MLQISLIVVLKFYCASFPHYSRTFNQQFRIFTLAKIVKMTIVKSKIHFLLNDSRATFTEWNYREKTMETWIYFWYFKFRFLTTWSVNTFEFKTPDVWYDTTKEVTMREVNVKNGKGISFIWKIQRNGFFHFWHGMSNIPSFVNSTHETKYFFFQIWMQ